MNSKISIRPVKESELRRVAAIRVAGWQSAYRGIVDDAFLDAMSIDGAEAKMRSRFKENNTFLVAEVAGQIVGFCRFVSDNSFTPEATDADCELTALYIDPPHQHTGVGTALFDYVVDTLRAQGRRHMILWCVKENLPAVSFYEKMGGKLAGEKMHTLGNNTLPIVMFTYEI